MIPKGIAKHNTNMERIKDGKKEILTKIKHDEPSFYGKCRSRAREVSEQSKCWKTKAYFAADNLLINSQMIIQSELTIINPLEF